MAQTASSARPRPFVATGALACGVCCILPFALPAAVLAGSGGALAWFSGPYHWMTFVAVAR